MAVFGALDWGILAVYVTAVLAIGFVLSRRVTSAEDFYIGRRTTPWWAIGISVVATYVSAVSFLGGPAWSYANSFAVIAIHLNYPIVIFLVISLFLPFFYNSGVPSIYDYVERRFGPACRSVISLIFLVSQALTSSAVLFVTALVTHFVTGIDVSLAIGLMAIIAFVYTCMGGTVAVIWTDVFQSAVLFVGAIVILICLLTRLPMPLPELLHQLKIAGKTHAFDLSLDFSHEATLWTGLIAMTMYHVTVYGANQMMVQRTLAARSIGDAKKSYLLMGFAAFLIYFLFFSLGVLLYGYYHGRSFENGNTIILEFAASQHIPGLMGVLAAAIVAASMSSLGAALNSLATITTVDFYQRYLQPHAGPQRYLAVTRIFSGAWMLIIVAPAILYAGSHGSVLQILSMVGSYFVGANFANYLLGFYSRDTTGRGLLIGIASGFVVVLLTSWKTNVAWPWYSVIGGLVTVAVAWTASRLTHGRQLRWSEYSIPGQQQLFRSNSQPTTEDGWYRVPGKIDRPSWLLLAYLLVTIAILVVVEHAF